MKSLKNQKCVKCGKPATMWLPGEDDVDLPYCDHCFDAVVNLGSLDEDDDDDYCPETLIGDEY